MDLSTLEDLADSGFTVVSGEQLTGLVNWCWEWGIATGDARFCVISVVLGKVDVWWREHDERGGVPGSLLAEIENLLRRGLSDSLGASTPAAGAQLAHEMGFELPLLPASEWVARGHVEYL